jgi:hypothetical protein
MIRRSWTLPASIEETLALWAASLREIKKWIRLLFNQDRVARNAGLFLESLLGDEQRKTGWMRAEAAGDLHDDGRLEPDNNIVERIHPTDRTCQKMRWVRAPTPKIGQSSRH